MGTISALPLGRTVRLLRTPVNRLVTVNTAAGDRLSDYVRSRWDRRKGGIRGFCKAIGVTPETFYGWVGGKNDPSLGALSAMADVLGVSRYEIVAAMDGEGPVGPLDEATRRAIREEVDRVLRERQ